MLLFIQLGRLEQKQNIAFEDSGCPNVQADKRHTEVIFHLAFFFLQKVTCNCLEKEKQFKHSRHSPLNLARPSCLQRSPSTTASLNIVKMFT